MAEDISDAKTQPIQDGTNPDFSNVDAGTDGTLELPSTTTHPDPHATWKV